MAVIDKALATTEERGGVQEGSEGSMLLAMSGEKRTGPHSPPSPARKMSPLIM
jgi:hypothetical protein